MIEVIKNKMEELKKLTDAQSQKVDKANRERIPTLKDELINLIKEM